MDEKLAQSRGLLAVSCFGFTVKIEISPTGATYVILSPPGPAPVALDPDEAEVLGKMLTTQAAMARSKARTRGPTEPIDPSVDRWAPKQSIVERCVTPEILVKRTGESESERRERLRRSVLKGRPMSRKEEIEHQYFLSEAFGREIDNAAEFDALAQIGKF